MKKTMTIKKLFGLNAVLVDETGREWSHRELYGAVVERIGLDRLIPLLPYDLDTLKEKLPQDQHFNNTSVAKWDSAGGWYNLDRYSNGATLIHRQNAPLPHMLHQLGLTTWSCSDCVSILKEAARLACERDGVYYTKSDAMKGA